MGSQLENQASQVILNANGVTGSKAITGTSAVTPPEGYYFFKIQTMAATVVAAQVDVTDAVNVDLTSITSIPVGSEVYGKWSSITLTSGEAIGYLAKA